MMQHDAEAVRAWVAGVLAGIYQPEPDEEIWAWAERTLRIPSTENEEMAGMLWSSAMTAYVRPLMEWVKQPGKGEFWIKKSSQVGFTMAVLIIICWMIVHRPGNVAYAIDSVSEARNISKSRLRRWIELNRLLEEMGESPDALNNLTFFLRGMTVYMLGAFSKGGWANKSISLFILDELDKHPYIEGEGNTVTLARERCKRPKNAKIIGFSTPGESNQISDEHARGTREVHLVKFPCCGNEQALTWETFVFGTKEFRDLAGGYVREKVEAEAHFACRLCGGRLHDRQKLPAIQAGRPVATNPAASGKIRSLHIWDAYSPFVSFGTLALEWIDAQGDEMLLERFFRGRRGEQYERTGRSLKTADLLQCVGGYSRGTVPFVPVLLCQAIDIQGDVQKAVKVAIDSRGDMWVVDWFISLQLSEAVEWAYENVTGPDGEVYQVTDGFIDDGHRAMEVRRMCLAHCPVFWPVKGRGGIQVRDIVGSSVLYVDGEEILGYHIAEDQFKWQLLKMITDREKRLKRGDLPVLHLPKEAAEEDEFLLELTNEIPVLKKNALGKEKWEWKKEGDNDYWDCIKYCLALWSIKRPVLVRAGATR
jgi:phage terminase large subunit GpA-like protein